VPPAAVAGRRGRRRWCSAKDRPRATTRRRTRRARARYGVSPNASAAALVRQQPTLASSMKPDVAWPKPPSPWPRHAVAGNDDRKAVVAAACPTSRGSPPSSAPRCRRRCESCRAGCAHPPATRLLQLRPIDDHRHSRSAYPDPAIALDQARRALASALAGASAASTDAGT